MYLVYRSNFQNAGKDVRLLEGSEQGQDWGRVGEEEDFAPVGQQVLGLSISAKLLKHPDFSQIMQFWHCDNFDTVLQQVLIFDCFPCDSTAATLYS